jgi:hypothetical protein
MSFQNPHFLLSARGALCRRKKVYAANYGRRVPLNARDRLEVERAPRK